jgi:hypothetical protein
VFADSGMFILFVKSKVQVNLGPPAYFAGNVLEKVGYVFCSRPLLIKEPG